MYMYMYIYMHVMLSLSLPDHQVEIIYLVFVYKKTNSAEVCTCSIVGRAHGLESIKCRGVQIPPETASLKNFSRELNLYFYRSLSNHLFTVVYLLKVSR